MCEYAALCGCSCDFACFTASEADDLVKIKHRIDKETILDHIQLSNFTSGSWLHTRSETYAYAYGNLRYYGVVYGPYGSRGPGHLRSLRTLLMIMA
jgi:hypothetical protein